jgi:hypothetical protein
MLPAADVARAKTNFAPVGGYLAERAAVRLPYRQVPSDIRSSRSDAFPIERQKGLGIVAPLQRKKVCFQSREIDTEPQKFRTFRRRYPLNQLP